MDSRSYRTILIALVVWMGIQSAQSQQCSPACKTGYKCVLNNCVLDVACPKIPTNVKTPSPTCVKPTDPLNKPKSKLESWFTKEIFADLFPKANLGFGPHECLPFSYEAFVIAARYFPDFGTEAPASNGFTAEENHRRDVAALFAHAIQETGENAADLYGEPTKVASLTPDEVAKADACFYRGGFYNWFEGGEQSGFLQPGTGTDPRGGDRCTQQGLYCPGDGKGSARHPCSQEKDGQYFKGCYFGRGAIQISYNFNYGLFGEWLAEQGIHVNLYKDPNLVMTKMDPPLSILASLWFYMTPQPPKPSMHDIIMGNWKPSAADEAAGYKGPALGPTSLVINNECEGDDGKPGAGGAGESRRIRAFKWFSTYFGFHLEDAKLLSCKNMLAKFQGGVYDTMSKTYGIEWTTAWRDDISCNCVPTSDPQAEFRSMPYFDPAYFPKKYAEQNEANREACIRDVYENPGNYKLEPSSSKCLTHPPAGIKPYTAPPTTPLPPGVTRAPCDGGPEKYADPTDCSKYIWCVNGKPNLMNCPAGTVFTGGVCGFGSCKGQAASTASGGNKDPIQCLEPYGKYPDPTSCSSYYQCNNGSPIKSPCPPGTVFSTNTKECGFSDGSCKDTSTTKPGGVQCLEPYGKYPDPKNCAKYYQCNFGTPILVPCPPGTEFDTEANECKMAGSAKCASGAATGPSKPAAQPQPSSTTKKPSGCGA